MQNIPTRRLPIPSLAAALRRRDATSVLPALRPPALAILLLLLAGGARPALAESEFHRADGVVWTIHDLAEYHKHKATFDLFTGRVGPASRPVKTWFGKYAPETIGIRFVKRGCSIGIKDRVVEVGDTCVIGRTTLADQTWPRTTVFAFYNWVVIPPIMAGWPEDDFWQPVSKMLFVELVRGSDGDAEAAKKEDELDTDAKRRKYQWFRSFRSVHGWAVFPRLFDIAKADGMDWTRIGANSQAPERVAYVFAYLSLAAGVKLGNSAKEAGVLASNPAVMDVLRARNLLRIADRKRRNTTAAWAAYRAGRASEVRALLAAGT